MRVTTPPIAPLSAPLLASVFSNAGVVIAANIYLIRTYVMSPRWRHVGGLPAQAHSGDSQAYNRPLNRTVFRLATGYPAGALLTLCCGLALSEEERGT